MIALCGREGTGKDTCADILEEPTYTEVVLPQDSLAAIVEVVYGDSGKSGKSLDSDKSGKFITALLTANIDPDIFSMMSSQRRFMIGRRAFATALKIIASIVFNIDYDVLSGDKLRKERELTTRRYAHVNLTGRTCLEFLGTLFRKWREDIWVDIYFRNKHSSIVSDLRFQNEYNALKARGAIIVCVARKESDLIIIDEDKHTHPAKWQFLQFKHDYVVINNSSIDDLKKKLFTVVQPLLMITH